MTSLRKLLLPLAVTSALVVSGCGSTTKSSTDTASTTTEATTTTASGDSTSSSSATTAPATTAAPLVTSPPATNPPATTPQIFTNFSVSNPAACPAPDVSFDAPSPSVTVSWTVTGADSVNLEIDGGLWGPYGVSGSENLPASCNAELHNVHTYSVVAIKNGQEIATKSKTRGS